MARTLTTLTRETYPCMEQPDLFFAESASNVAVAKSLCRTCPALTPCLTGALERREPWGVWGGEVFENGVVIATKRGRGRPRKNTEAA